MPSNNHHQSSPYLEENFFKILWPVAILAGILGVFLSWSVLSGDPEGRVNLLYLLLVYLLIPILSLFISLLTLVFNRPINLAYIWSKLPAAAALRSHHYQQLLRKTQQLNITQHWFLMQSQIAAMAFSLASLLVFFILLLLTDINFVWRSTLLTAEDIFPLLELVAKPWWFWEAAQPSKGLISLTQDFRIVKPSVDATIYSGWWQFILATQVFYSLLLRLLVLFISRLTLINKLKNDKVRQLEARDNRISKNTYAETIKSNSVSEIEPMIAVNNWAGAPVEILKKIPGLNMNSDYQLLAGPRASQTEQMLAERWCEKQVLIVKAWEPPLRELEDFIAGKQGYLLPLEWDTSSSTINVEQSSVYELQQPSQHHLSEWQRLANKYEDWPLYLPSLCGDKV